MTISVPCDLVGWRSGRLVVTSYAYYYRRFHMWNVRCDCGVEKVVRHNSLLRRETGSCGCLIREKARDTFKKHGKSGTRVYKVWCDMIYRCAESSSSHSKYYRYGGRGIAVCDRWKEFNNFYADMGDPPLGWELDRIDNEQGYYPENCRWVTQKQNARNKCNTRLLTMDGETHCLAEWAEKTGIGQSTIHRRLTRGWSVHRALTAAVRATARH